MHTAQSMHSSGSIVRKFGPSRKQSTGQTSTQSVYLQRMQDSVTTWVIGVRLFVHSVAKPILSHCHTSALTAKRPAASADQRYCGRCARRVADDHQFPARH